MKYLNIMKISVCVYATGIMLLTQCSCAPSERALYGELSKIINKYERPTMPAESLKALLLKMERNQSKAEVYYGTLGNISMVESVALTYWDYEQEKQAWELLKDHEPDGFGVLYPSSGDLLVYLSIVNQVSLEEIKPMLDKWTASLFPPLLSTSSIESLFEKQYSPALSELALLYEKIFNTTQLEPLYHVSLKQYQWIKNVMFLLRVCNNDKNVTSNDVILISKLTQIVFDLFTYLPYENHETWASFQHELMYPVIWILNLAARIGCPPLDLEHNSIWIKRYQSVLNACPPNAPVRKLLQADVKKLTMANRNSETSLRCVEHLARKREGLEQPHGNVNTLLDAHVPV